MVFTIEEAFEKLKQKELEEWSARLASTIPPSNMATSMPPRESFNGVAPNQVSSVISVALSNTNNWHQDVHSTTTTTTTSTSTSTTGQLSVLMPLGSPLNIQTQATLTSTSVESIALPESNYEKSLVTIRSTTPTSILPSVETQKLPASSSTSTLLVCTTITLGAFLFITIVIIIFGSMKYMKIRKQQGLHCASPRSLHAVEKGRRRVVRETTVGQHAGLPNQSAPSYSKRASFFCCFYFIRNQGYKILITFITVF